MSDPAQPRLGFRAAQRLRRGADFRAVREDGRRLDGGWFLLGWRRRDDDGPTRAGVVAARTVGPAVTRNRAKRLLREMFRRHQHLLPRGLDLVLVARPAMSRVRLRDLDQRFVKLAGQLERTLHS